MCQGKVFDIELADTDKAKAEAALKAAADSSWRNRYRELSGRVALGWCRLPRAGLNAHVAEPGASSENFCIHETRRWADAPALPSIRPATTPPARRGRTATAPAAVSRSVHKATILWPGGHAPRARTNAIQQRIHEAEHP